MWSIVTYFWQICILKAGPEGVPSSRLVTSALILIYASIALLSTLLSKPETAFFDIVVAVSLGIIIEASLIYALLLFKNVSRRYLSTFSALLGSNTILLLVLLPLSFLQINVGDELLLDIINAISLVCFFWWLAVVGFILHRACAISVMQGAVLAFVIEMLNIFAIQTFLPEFY